MRRQMIFPLVLGIAGTAIFLWLGTWQLSRMQWKSQILHEIDRRLGADTVALPASPDPDTDKYLLVRVTGDIGRDELHVLTFADNGPGYKVIVPMTLQDGRRILLDRGYIPEMAKDTQREGGETTVIGALVWPQETDSYVPQANRAKNIWFARDVPLMAETLGTGAVMVSVLKTSNLEGVTPLPVNVNIPNRHLEYVLTWYSLAIIWIGMTGALLWRIKRKTM